MSTDGFSRSGFIGDAPPAYETVQPVLNQPRKFSKFGYFHIPVTCLSGLESLREVGQLSIEKEPVDCCSCSCEFSSTYNVKNNYDQKLFSISPVNVSCMSYDMQLFDNFGNPVVLFQRCRECCSGLKIEAIHSQGTLIGTVQREVGFLNSAYIVGDANGQTVFEVKRSAIKFFPKNVDFSIKLAAGSIEIGKITWIRTGLMSGRRLYKIIFPKDLAPEMKVA
ncbi:uncharacterized protein LOC135134431 [Zophobas morio]|uniref:uncharacterized protein LOC135134431 n=1 Tax=Zophobas morio TaxID=2755281 RepID=UPI003082B5F9